MRNPNRTIFSVTIVVTMCISGCDQAPRPSAEPPTVKEAELVKATMDPKCEYRNGPADVRPSKKNVGTVVQFGPAYYLIQNGKVMAGNKEAQRCSPTLPMTKDLTTADFDS